MSFLNVLSREKNYLFGGRTRNSYIVYDMYCGVDAAPTVDMLYCAVLCAVLRIL